MISPGDTNGVAFDLEAMDRLARELDAAAGLLAESAAALARDLAAAGVPSTPARTLAEVSSWCWEHAADVRRRAQLAREAQTHIPVAAPPPPPAQSSSGGGGVRGWLADRVDDVGDAVTGAGGAVADFTLGAGGHVDDLLDAAGDWAVDTWEAGGRALDNVTDKAAKAFSDVVHWAGSTASGVVQWVDGALDDAGGWVDKHLSGVRNWIGKHANILRIAGDIMSTVGKALVVAGAAVAIVSAAVGAFTGVGFLGEIPAGAIIAVGFALWGAGDALGTVADWGEGKINGRQLLIDIVIDVTSALVIGKALKIARKVLEPLMPRLKKFVEDLVRRRRGGGPAPDLPHVPSLPHVPDLPHLPDRPHVPDRPPTPDLPHVPGPPVQPHLPPGVEPPPPLLPGLDHPLRGGTKDDPYHYEYDNPAGHLRSVEKPTNADLEGLGKHSDYKSGTPEHMYTGWRDYLAGRLPGQKVKSWAKWRDGYIRNQGHNAQGLAYEKAFRTEQGFDGADGWVWHGDGSKVPSVTTPSGARRDFDLLDFGRARAYELKSGNAVSKTQLEADAELVGEDWEIVYVFGRTPSTATQKRLAAAGIRWETWHAIPVMR